MAGILLYLFFFTPFIYTDEPRDIKGDNTIYVASISWHTGIMVPAKSLPDSIWPEGYDYSKFPYLEIGWGDRDFYQHPDFNLWYAIKAIFWPTPTALHVFPFSPDNIPMNYVETKVVKLSVTEKELNDLTRFLLHHFKFNDKGKLIPLQDGLYYNSQFFAGSTKYYFPKNSNVWAAIGLKRAGFPFIPILYQTTEMVLNRADNFGEVIVDD